MRAQLFGDDVDCYIFILILIYFCNKMFIKNTPPPPRKLNLQQNGITMVNIACIPVNVVIPITKYIIMYIVQKY